MSLQTFIQRPIFAFVISIFIVIAGLAAIINLPVAQYPEVAPPVVLVTATYPGASAEVLEQTVASPIENAINGVEGLLYMSSTSFSNGVTSITLTFKIGTNIDLATINVNNRVKLAEPRLPEEVRRQGVIVEKSSSSYLQVIAFYSPDGKYDELFISNYVTLNILDQLKRIPGATNVQNFGAKDYAMRIWLQPDRMAQLKVTTTEVAAALREQNAQFAAGKIGQPPISSGQEMVYSVTTKGRLATVKEFEEVIIRSSEDGSSLRIKDIARVEIGSKDYDFIGKINGKPATLVGIFLQPGANALEVSRQVQELLSRVSQRFPNGLAYSVPYDTTRFVDISIREVLKTLGEAMILVFLVVFIFLQNWRATLIPTLAVPVSLIGTFAGLYVLGYTINTLTLFGMVLATGIVVDDAIVVLENVERIMHERGISAKEATQQAMIEVTGPVIAIVLVLCAVFIPIAFLGGLTGELYRQFAVTISISVMLSGIIALSMTPALCVFFLKPEDKSQAKVFTIFNSAFDHITRYYVAGIRFFIIRRHLSALLYLMMLLITVWFWYKTPHALVPDEDQGYFIAAIYLPDGATLERTDQVVDQVIEIARSNPNNQDILTFSGYDLIGGGYKNSAAVVYITQKHWDLRSVTTPELISEFDSKTAGIQEALVLAFNPPAIFGLGNTGGFEFYIQNHGAGGSKQLAEVMEKFVETAGKEPSLSGVSTLWRYATPQLYIELDREHTKALGISLNDAFDTLSATFGSYYVNDFNKYGRSWQVLLSAEANQRNRPEDIGRIFIRNRHQIMVPLSTLAKIIHTTGPDSLDRFNNLPAVKIIGSASAGYSSGQAIETIEEIAKRVLPADFSYDWSGSSYQEKHSSGSSLAALLLAVIMVYLILAALYERWLLPISVLLALPFGTFGSLLAITYRGYSNDVYFQIGLVTLLGLAAKNAILIVEYALIQTQNGWKPGAAALEAGRLRFRPIIMTSLAFILGVMPLAFSNGAGAAARQSVGMGVLGGMLAATFLAILFVPLFYYLLMQRQRNNQS